MAAATGETLQGLERGLAVIQAFSHEAPAMTLSEVARRTGISRATARRILLTLEALGFVRSDGREFSLSPRVLSLGWSYLSSLSLWEVARPFMEDLSAEMRETCSACTLDLPDIVFVARVPAPRRILMMSLGVGSRLPAYATAMGRVLLAGLPDGEVTEHLASTALESLTHRTVTDPARLGAIVAAVREQGFSLVDEELELGLRSLSVPLRGPDGRPVAALNLCAAAARVSVAEMHARYLPAMRSTADTISTAWLQKT
jgi:IclR family transcriptional regulator, pca regulon regulatory protein